MSSFSLNNHGRAGPGRQDLLIGSNSTSRTSGSILHADCSTWRKAAISSMIWCISTSYVVSPSENMPRCRHSEASKICRFHDACVVEEPDYIVIICLQALSATVRLECSAQQLRVLVQGCNPVDLLPDVLKTTVVSLCAHLESAWCMEANDASEVSSPFCCHRTQGLVGAMLFKQRGL